LRAADRVAALRLGYRFEGKQKIDDASAKSPPPRLVLDS